MNDLPLRSPSGSCTHHPQFWPDRPDNARQPAHVARISWLPPGPAAARHARWWRVTFRCWPRDTSRAGWSPSLSPKKPPAKCAAGCARRCNSLKAKADTPDRAPALERPGCQMDAARIGTIHSLCAEILQAAPRRSRRRPTL